MLKPQDPSYQKETLNAVNVLNQARCVWECAECLRARGSNHFIIRFETCVNIFNSNPPTSLIMTVLSGPITLGIQILFWFLIIFVPFRKNKHEHVWGQWASLLEDACVCTPEKSTVSCVLLIKTHLKIPFKLSSHHFFFRNKLSLSLSRYVNAVTGWLW